MPCIVPQRGKLKGFEKDNRNNPDVSPFREILDEGAKGKEIEITSGDGTTYRVAVTVR